MGDKARFKDNGNGTVTDTETNLMWKQTDSFQEMNKWMNWHQANEHITEVNTQKFAGHLDWRMPNLEEAESLFDEEWSIRDLDRFEIYISTSFSPGGGGFTTWTTEQRPHNGAVIFYYRYGHANINNKDDITKDSVRAVRNIT